MYRLMIAEKPSVANSLAAVLGAKQRRDGYVEGNGWLVATIQKSESRGEPSGVGEMQIGAE